jgi:uncharacterized protein
MSASIATAESLDGRTFAFRCDVDAQVVPGDPVILRLADGRSLLGQVRSKEAHDDGARGVGAILGAVRDGAFSPADPGPFVAEDVGHADLASLRSFQERTAGGPVLRIGTVSLPTGDSGAVVRAAGFNRHTFLCGQSGSGKTYALGVLLERLLAETSLRMVVLDPNGDYVRLGAIREGADAEGAERLRPNLETVRAFGFREGQAPLRIRYDDLEPAAGAALLGLDPIADREEYNLLLALAAQNRAQDAQAFMKEYRESADPAARALAMRMENLGVVTWDVWARGADSVLAAIDEQPRAAVLDLSGAPTTAERTLVAVDVLDHLWSRRADREPVLIVIDEAHNVCSREPADALQRLATERLIQIAGEGRKYGLWLLLATQRPSKLHHNVLTQCDNLALMRMNSPGDLAELGDVFGFAPPAMLAAAPTFGKGEALVAGGFALAPMRVRISGRLTEEPGDDVDVPV